MAGLFGGHDFGFLFRRDEGVVEQPVWWAGVAALALPLGLMSLVWALIGGAAHREFTPTMQLFDARTGFAYLYLLVFAAAILLIAISYYNLSAKRLRARHLPPGLAGLLPLAALLTGAMHWMAPRIGDALPGWSVLAVDLAMLAVVAWNVWELGITTRNRPA